MLHVAASSFLHLNELEVSSQNALDVLGSSSNWLNHEIVTKSSLHFEMISFV